MPDIEDFARYRLSLIADALEKALGWRPTLAATQLNGKLLTVWAEPPLPAGCEDQGLREFTLIELSDYWPQFQQIAGALDLEPTSTGLDLLVEIREKLTAWGVEISSRRP
jgi:hypothetical protein